MCVWGQSKEESKRRNLEHLHVKITPLESFLTLFLNFFPLLDVKITKKFSQETEPQYYNTSIWQLPLYILKKSFFFSTCTNYLNT